MLAALLTSWEDERAQHASEQTIRMSSFVPSIPDQERGGARTTGASTVTN